MPSGLPTSAEASSRAFDLAGQQSGAGTRAGVFPGVAAAGALAAVAGGALLLRARSRRDMDSPEPH